MSLRAGENGIVSPTHLAKTLDDLARLDALERERELSELRAERDAWKEKYEALDRRVANSELQSRGR